MLDQLENPLIDSFHFFSHNFSALYCVYIVRGNSVLVMYGSLRVCWMLQMSMSSFGSSYLKVTCKL